MERLMTKCCWDEREVVRDDTGMPEVIYCKSCEGNDPDMVFVEICPYCDRPKGYCRCS